MPSEFYIGYFVVIAHPSIFNLDFSIFGKGKSGILHLFFIFQRFCAAQLWHNRKPDLAI